jgi:hypothetical protein
METTKSSFWMIPLIEKESQDFPDNTFISYG